MMTPAGILVCKLSSLSAYRKVLDSCRIRLLSTQTRYLLYQKPDLVQLRQNGILRKLTQLSIKCVCALHRTQTFCPCISYPQQRTH